MAGDEQFDVCVIGCGIAGAAVARELGRWQASCVVLEAGSDVACGATRANSGIVHSGYDPLPGTAKARFNVEGSRMYPQLAADLGFHFVNNGSLVVAFSEDERPALEELLARGKRNGVPALRVVEADELHELEPNLSPDAVCALLVPTGGICNPYGACWGLAENAVANGTQVRLLSRAAGIERLDGGGFRVRVERIGLATGTVEETYELQARCVVNAAGAHAGEVAALVSDERFTIVPRAGEYELFDTELGGTFARTVFQVPTAAGKGVLITPTTGGNLLVGPNAVARDDLDDTDTRVAGLEGVHEAARKTWPGLPWGAIANFAGVRASCPDAGDFIIGEPADCPGFFNIGGFDSPGLTAAPAVGLHVASAIAQRLGAPENPSFDPRRVAPQRFARMTREQQAAACADDPAAGRVVCRCEQVTEADIRAACRTRIPALTTDAVKWRTRAGMGRCQAGFCLPEVARIVADELGVSVTNAVKGAPGGTLVAGERGCAPDLPQVAGLSGVDDAGATEEEGE